MHYPEISVIMPAYNAAQYVAPAIQSILAQSFEDFELIIIDDCSTDNTASIIETFADKRIITIGNEQNKGNYRSRNMGIRKSRGKYICIMDADDISMPNRFQTQLRWFKENKKTALTGSWGDIIDRTSNIIDEYVAPADFSAVKLALLRNMCFIHSSVMIKKEYLQKYYLSYNERFYYAADYELMVRCAQKFRLNIIPEKLVQYRKHDMQISTSKSSTQARYADSVRLKQLQFFRPQFNNKQTTAYLKLLKAQLLFDEEMELSFECLNKLLSQNSKLRLFNQEKLHYFFMALLSRYKHKQSDRRSALGGFAIEERVVNLLLSKIPQGRLIVEFGSGFGTTTLLNHYKVVSIEHNLFYAINRGVDHVCIHAPLQNGWYKPEQVAGALQKNPDAILVDGPPGSFRKNILGNLHLFEALTCPFIFDDIDREADYNTALDFCRKMQYDLHVFQGENKKVAWCEKAG